MKTQIQNKLKSLQEQKQHSKFWNITWQQGVFLSNLIELKEPKTILEIGTSNGFSTLWLTLNSLEDSQIHTIEIDEKRYNIAKTNFKEAKTETITQHLGDAFEILPKLKEKKLKFNFIFVDAAHQFYRKLLDRLEELNLLEEDYTIIFDNVSTHKQLLDFKEHAKNKYSSEHINIGGGFLIIKSLRQQR